MEVKGTFSVSGPIRQLAVFAVILLILAVHAQAKKGGVEDQDLNLSGGTEQGKNANTGQCGTSCHSVPSTGADISITATPSGPYITGQTGINIIVATANISSGGNISGIFLLNNSIPLSKNIKYDGWVIARDPNNNAAPYNWNEKTNLSTLNQTFNWTITAPVTNGTYYIKAQARYGSSGSTNSYNITSAPLTMTVLNPPPNITSWDNSNTADNTLLFNVMVFASVMFNVTASQMVSYNWTYDGTDQGQNYDNFIKQFNDTGLHYINATVSNSNGTDHKNWTVNVQPEPTPTETSGSGGDSGSGGSVPSGEPYSNIQIAGSGEEFLQSGIPRSYIFPTLDLALYEIIITPKKSYGYTSMRIEELKGLPAAVDAAPNTVYVYSSVWLDTKELTGGAGIRDATIKFKVKNDWLSENHFDHGDVRLLRWDGSEWISLKTMLMTRGQEYVYYEAKTDAFGPFAISAAPVYSSPGVQITGTQASIEAPVQKIEEPDSIEEQGFPLWGYILIVFALIGVLLYVIVFNKKN